MRVALGDLADLYIEGTQAAVFIDHQVVVLSELGTAIVLRVAEQQEVMASELAAYLKDEFGSPDPSREESALEATLAQLRELQARGVLNVIDETAAD